MKRLRASDRLRQAVLGACGDREALAETAEALVVVRVHARHERADEVLQAPAVDVDVVAAERAEPRPVRPASVWSPISCTRSPP